MPNGFWYASGGYSVEQGKPASAFSKGDLLMLNSSSSWSRVPSVASGIDNDIAGVALCDSTQSIEDRVPVLIPEDDTLFWASLSTALSSATVGSSADLFFDATDNNRYYVDPGSSNTARAVIVRGTVEVDQSVQSVALVRLIYNAGNLTFS